MTARAKAVLSASAQVVAAVANRPEATQTARDIAESLIRQEKTR